jgi:hypothetical protein
MGSPTAPPATTDTPAAPTDGNVDLADTGWGNEVPFRSEPPAGDTSPAEGEQQPETAPTQEEPPPAAEGQRILDPETVKAIWQNPKAREELLEAEEAQEFLSFIAQEQAEEQQWTDLLQPENDQVWVQASQAGLKALNDYDADLARLQEGQLEDPTVLQTHVRNALAQGAIAHRQAAFRQIHFSFVRDLSEFDVPPALQAHYERALGEFDRRNMSADPRIANTALAFIDGELNKIRRSIYEGVGEQRGRAAAVKDVESKRQIIEDNKLRELAANGVLGKGTPGVGGVQPPPAGSFTAEQIENMSDAEYERNAAAIRAQASRELFGGS